LNESLRLAILRARLGENDVAAHLGVDPKTVRRWLSGRVPYPSSRAALAELLGADEANLWPEAGGPLSGRRLPEGLTATYTHRWAIPHDVWAHLFDSARQEISVLAYSALFLAEDSSLLDIIGQKAFNGVRVRLALRDPESSNATLLSEDKGIDDLRGTEARNALTRYEPLLKSTNVAIRLHQAVLYNSLYRADGQVFVNQHTYGIGAVYGPVFCLSVSGDGDMMAPYRESFEKVWNNAKQYIHRDDTTVRQPSET
jgi:hypothetical protein